jgi:hypothetical protein
MESKVQDIVFTRYKRQSSNIPSKDDLLTRGILPNPRKLQDVSPEQIRSIDRLNDSSVSFIHTTSYRVNLNLCEQFSSILDLRKSLEHQKSLPGSKGDIIRKWYSSLNTFEKVKVQHSKVRNALPGEEIAPITEQQYGDGLKKFVAPKFLQELENNITSQYANLFNEVERRVIEYNDRGLGVFDFSKASAGIYYLREYWSETHQRTFDDIEVENIGDFENEEWILIQDGTPVDKRHKLTENGLPAVGTNSKKVWAKFNRELREQPSVEIFISTGNYNEVEAKDFIWSGMAGIMLAKVLGIAGIKVKINAVIGWRPQNAEEYCAFVVPVKNYNETLDRDALALLTSDQRFWRTEGYAMAGTALALCGYKEGGYGFTGAALKYALENCHYRPEALKFCFGRIQSERDAMTEIEVAIKTVTSILSKTKQAA